MRKHIKNLLEHNSLFIAISITIAIAYLSLKNLQIDVPIKVSFLDKILHFIAYFTLSISWFFYLKNKKSKKIFLTTAIIILIYGILMEFLQGWFNPKRTKDFWDVMANSVGIISALFAFNSIELIYKKIFADYN